MPVSRQVVTVNRSRRPPAWPELCDRVDTRTGVDDSDDKVPFRFTGKIGKVTIKLGLEQLTEKDQVACGYCFGHCLNIFSMAFATAF